MNLKTKEAREEMGRISKRMQQIVDSAENEGRDLTQQEVKEFDKLNRTYNRYEKVLKEHSYNTPGQNAKDVLDVYSNGNEDGVELWESVSGENKGQKIPVLNRKANFYNVMKSRNPEAFKANYSWSQYLRDRIKGYTANNPLQPGETRDFDTETRVMNTTADSSLVPTPLSAEVIQNARNMSRVFQAGARTVPMNSKTLDIARVTGDPATEWKAESDSFTAGDVTVDGVQLSAKTLIAGTKMSVELSEDAPNASQVVRNSLSGSLALELDRVSSVGSGSGQEPEGLFNNSNVQEIEVATNGAQPTDYSNFSKAYQKVLEKNGIPRSAIFAPRTFGQLDRLTDNDSNPLRPPQSWQDLQKLVTNQVPIDQTQGTANDASTVFIGDYRQMLVGVRTNLRIEVSRVASDSTNSAWEDLEVWIRAYMRADIAFAHPDHFVRVVGLIGSGT